MITWYAIAITAGGVSSNLKNINKRPCSSIDLKMRAPRRVDSFFENNSICSPSFFYITSIKGQVAQNFYIMSF